MIGCMKPIDFFSLLPLGIRDNSYNCCIAALPVLKFSGILL